MCATCGCGNVEVEHSHAHDGHDHDHHGHDHGHPGHGHSHHDHGHEHSHHDHEHGHSHHDHEPTQSQPRVVSLEQEVLARNNQLAERNRGWFEGRRIFALNLLGAPGAGKTTLLEQTLRRLGDVPRAVIEGDQATHLDADRIRAAGGRVVQVNTGTGCHLDARMVSQSLRQVEPQPDSVLFIENVGNLVCPALFDLGERTKVVVLSVTEGEDKPLKYPHIFRASDVLVLNKVDLLAHLAFNAERCLAYARQVNPALKVFRISASRGDGLDEWVQWIEATRALPTAGPGASRPSMEG